jgi:SNF2 family DNA or RNA helicase
MSSPAAASGSLALRDPRASGIEAPRLRLELQPHQKHNVSRFLQCVRFGDGGVLVADDLGLGKTFTAIACIQTLREVVVPACRNFKALVVVPKSVLEQWRDEIRKFTYLSPNQVALNGNCASADTALYHVITYETLRTAFESSYVKKDKDFVVSQRGLHSFFEPDAYGVVVYDEVHRLRNRTAKIHHAAKFLGATTRAEWITPRIGLSGTPIINGYADVSNIASVLGFPKRFTETKFFETLSLATGADFVTTCFIKHFKSETVQLPPLLTTIHTLSMSDEERLVHNNYVGALNVEVGQFNEKRCTTFTDVIVALVRLRQVAIHPDLPAATPSGAAAAASDDDDDDDDDGDDSVGGDDDDDDGDDDARAADVRRRGQCVGDAQTAAKRRRTNAQAETAKAKTASVNTAMQCAKDTWERSTKLRWLMERVKFYKADGRRFLIFTSFSTAATLVHEILSAHGFTTRLFIGSSTDSARRDAVLAFRSNLLDGLVLTFGAGGTGLHLAPAGSAVLHLDATWTPAAHAQAECRLHRFGTVRDVLNDFVVLEGSVDSYIIDNVHVKKTEFANSLDRTVQHLQAKPVKHNASAVNMVQVLSLLRWFASMRRKNMYERLAAAEAGDGGLPLR